MAARGNWRGHPMYFDEASQAWRYEDDNSLVSENWHLRPCGHCREFATPAGHDACIADLPGVLNACCGHGETAAAYVQFADDRPTLRGSDAMAFFHEARTPAEVTAEAWASIWRRR